MKKVRLIVFLMLTIMLVIIPLNSIADALAVELVAIGAAALIALGICVSCPDALTAMASDMINGLSAASRQVLNWCGLNKKLVLDASTESEIKSYIKNAQNTYENGKVINYPGGSEVFDKIGSISGTNNYLNVIGYDGLRIVSLRGINYYRNGFSLSVHGLESDGSLTLNPTVSLGLGWSYNYDDEARTWVFLSMGNEYVVLEQKMGIGGWFAGPFIVDVERGTNGIEVYTVDAQGNRTLQFIYNFTQLHGMDYEFVEVSNAWDQVVDVYDLGVSYLPTVSYIYNEGDIIYNNSYIYNDNYSIANKEIEFPVDVDLGDIETLVDVSAEELTITDTVQPHGYENDPALGGIVGWLQSVYGKVCDVVTSVKTLPQAILEGIIDWVEVAFIPPEDFYTDFFNDIKDILKDVIDIDALKTAMLSLFPEDESNWEGIKISLPWYTSSELLIVSPVFVNNCATWIKASVSGLMYFFTGLFIFRKIGRYWSA